MDKNIYLGILYDCDDTDLISINNLIEGINIPSRYSREQLLEEDCEDFIRFIYDPFTGEKINWDELKKSI